MLMTPDHNQRRSAREGAETDHLNKLGKPAPRATRVEFDQSSPYAGRPTPVTPS
jgi:hypothetical protein